MSSPLAGRRVGSLGCMSFLTGCTGKRKSLFSLCTVLFSCHEGPSTPRPLSLSVTTPVALHRYCSNKHTHIWITWSSQVSPLFSSTKELRYRETCRSSLKQRRKSPLTSWRTDLSHSRRCSYPCHVTGCRGLRGCLFLMTRPSENVGFTGATIRGVVAKRVTSGGWRSPNSSRQRSSRTLPPPSTRSCLFLSLPLFHPPPLTKTSLSLFLPSLSVPQRVTLEATDGREERRTLRKQLLQKPKP